METLKPIALGIALLASFALSGCGGGGSDPVPPAEKLQPAPTPGEEESPVAETPTPTREEMQTPTPEEESPVAETPTPVTQKPAVNAFVFGEGRYEESTTTRAPVTCEGRVCEIAYPKYGQLVREAGKLPFRFTEDRELGDNGALFGLRATRTTGNGGVSAGRLEGALFGGTVDSLGTWGEYHVSIMLSHSVPHDRTVRDRIVRIQHPLSYGYGTGSNPMEGSATWEGSAVSEIPFDRLEVYWDASMTVDFESATLSLRLREDDGTEDGGWRSSSGWSGVPIVDGQFESRRDSGHLKGMFYGPNHEEAGGIFSQMAAEEQGLSFITSPPTPVTRRRVFDGVFSLKRQ